jgi:hypothetical protein
MNEQDRIFDAFRNCISEPKCKDCPWTECDTLKNRIVEIPIDLALAVIRMLKAQEPVEPTIGGDADGPCGNWWYQCGKCKEAIDYHDRYCRNCGQAVKWE